MSTGKLFDDDALQAPTTEAPLAEDDNGAARVRVPDRTQMVMVTYDVDALIGPEHPARAMWELLGRMDLSGLYEQIKARGSRPGRAATDPKLLLCLWLYATSEGVGSARQLARLTTAHDAYKWICGGVSVNHDLLADFRVSHEAELDALLTQLLTVLLQAGLVTLRRVAQDGVKVRASAGAASFRTKKRLRQFELEAQSQVRRVKRLADEDPSRTRERAAERRAVEERSRRLEQALDQMRRREEKARRKADEEQASVESPPADKSARATRSKEGKAAKELRVSTTDPEARVMKMADGGFRPAYNVQLASDVDSQFVVGVSVSNNGTDYGELGPMVAQVEERLAPVDQVLVDGGFVNLATFDDLEKKGVTLYAPVSRSRSKDRDPHARKPNDTDRTFAWRTRMATEDAKAIYKDRAATAERINADLREHRGLTKLRVRGLDRVRPVVLLMVLAYNLGHLAAVGGLS
jgi:transposase